ncbi:MAG: PIG-L family deacetylase [Ferruginibacter sp.]|nr:PIG-L family deacetylase [Ferruginibacter sp.]
MMIRIGVLLLAMIFNVSIFAQSASSVLHDIQKLAVHGTVLYIAAHPDDENTRLLSYLVNEKKYRTGYLSLTRGDGGQNLIGDEQGIEMGLIRTQELIAARKVDGAEQFFTRAYDFGYSKSPEEALRLWGHEEVLSDVVWTIRTFRPDVIICRFPSTGEGGHGHHTASAILAAEAYDAAADPNRFPEHFKHGARVWQAKRLLWNTYSFEGMNTTRDDQFKVDCGGYNALLGWSYGEMSAQSRSKHSSQGFGVPAQRGTSFEYFETLKGTKPVNDLMEGVPTGAEAIVFKKPEQLNQYRRLLHEVVKQFTPLAPYQSVPALQEIENLLKLAEPSPLVQYKIVQLQNILRNVSGIFMEATVREQQIVAGDTAFITFSIINRNGLPMQAASADFTLHPSHHTQVTFKDTTINKTVQESRKIFIPVQAAVSQPYWLHASPNGLFTVSDQALRNLPEKQYPQVLFSFTLYGKPYQWSIPLQYKFTEPTKGEIYQPAYVTAPVHITLEPTQILYAQNSSPKTVQVKLEFNKNFNDTLKVLLHAGKKAFTVGREYLSIPKGQSWLASYPLPVGIDNASSIYATVESKSFASLQNATGSQDLSIKMIRYPHIPDQIYHRRDTVQLLNMDLKISGKRIGYIQGAGDKVADALKIMGYEVDYLQQSEITHDKLNMYDAIVTGVRAYNINDWLFEAYPVLMQYVHGGGVLLVQYNTNNRIAPLKAQIGPYPFTITRNRITNEQSPVHMQPGDHRIFNHPNKISPADFEGWVQERSVYHAGEVDPAYTQWLTMNDPGEKPLPGALIVAHHGSGKFIYTGLSLFRQLPAGVPGAFRLLANLLAR